MRIPGWRRLVGLEHRWNIVLGVAGGEQHAGHGEDVVDPLLAQPIEAGDGSPDWRIRDSRIRRGTPGRRCCSASASTANSPTARWLRLPWPQSMTPVPGGNKGRSSIFPPQLRIWSPIWVDRTGHVFQPHSWAAARAAVMRRAILAVNQGLGRRQLRMLLKIIRGNKHLPPLPGAAKGSAISGARRLWRRDSTSSVVRLRGSDSLGHRHCRAGAQGDRRLAHRLDRARPRTRSRASSMW